jgi:Flp pilus assembly protein TadD
MAVTRILDLIILALLATVVLLPRPDATVKPALTLDAERRARVAELQSTLVGRPDAVDASVELANIFLDGHRPDWALATVTAAAKHHPNDYRLHQLRAIAYADRFEGEPAFTSVQRAVELCDATPPPAGAPACGDATRGRLALLSATLQEVSKVDMKREPALAKDRIFKTLHPTYIPKPSERVQKKAAPSAKPATPPAK